MKNPMSYQGYTACIAYDEDEVFVGHVAGIVDRVSFHAETVTNLRDAIHKAVGEYLETCAKIGKDPQKAYSVQVLFHVSPEVHRKAALAAEL